MQTNLYSLNKDELVYLVSTIEAKHLARIAVLENENEKYRKTLTGHIHDLQFCKSHRCPHYLNRVNEDFYCTAQIMPCTKCQDNVCRLHSVECIECDNTFCKECAKECKDVCPRGIIHRFCITIEKTT